MERIPILRASVPLTTVGYLRPRLRAAETEGGATSHWNIAC